MMGNTVHKQSANLSIRSDLLCRAKQQNINLSKTELIGIFRIGRMKLSIVKALNLDPLLHSCRK